MNEVHSILEEVAQAGRGLVDELASPWFLVQIAVILAAIMIDWAVGALVRKRLDPLELTMGWPPMLRLAARAVLDRIGLMVFVVLAFTAQAVISASTWPSNGYLVGIAARLATAWLVIGLLASVIRNKLIFRAVAVSAWAIAALSILGLLDRTSAALDTFAIVIGGLRISPLLVLKTAGLLLLALWLANAVGNFADRRLQSAADLTPSLQVLVSKLLKLALISLAVVIVLSSVGIDLTALAFLSGAIGLGIGFGLQKIVSNLVSGIILLADKSIKPGDIISVGDSFGWVDELGARYTAVGTRDGREFLIPNEDLVTQQVINWSRTSEDIRVEIKFGTSYDCDPHRVIALALAAAREMPRVLADPPPVCFLLEFGESALDFSLRFWIRDPAEGITNLRSAVMLKLWDVFRQEGIEIPYPQRDLRLRTPVHIVKDAPDVRGGG